MAELSFESVENIYNLGLNAVTLEVTTVTYTGTPVEGSEVEITYRIQYLDSLEICTEQPKEIHETFTITTGEGGIGTHHFISEYEVSEGDIIEFTANWIDVTGALLQDELFLRVGISEWTLDLETSIMDPLPGMMFGFYVSINDFYENPIIGEQVSVTLYENVYDEFEQIIGLILVDECFAVSDDKRSVQCLMNFAEPKEYTLRGSFQDEFETTVSKEWILGRSQKSWEEQPLVNFEGFNLKLDKEEYSYGDTVTLSFHAVRNDPVWMFLIWGDDAKSRKQITRSNGRNNDAENFMNSVSFNLGDECIGKCALTVITSEMRVSEPQEYNFPISQLFDIEAPRVTTHGTIEISVPFEDRNISVNVDAPERSRPGERVDIKISFDSENDINEAEIAVFVVEKVYLDLEPNPVVLLHEQFMQFYDAVHNSKSNMEYFVNSASLKSTIDTFMERLRVDPWITPLWDIYPRGNAQIDMKNETFWELKVNEITYFPPYDFEYYRQAYCEETKKKFLLSREENEIHEQGQLFFGAKRKDTSDVDEFFLDEIRGINLLNHNDEWGWEEDFEDFEYAWISEEEPQSSPEETPEFFSSTAFELRDDFVITPLFIGEKIIRGNQATISLELPDNVGTFNIRVYAVDDKSRFGAGETEIIVTKPITMQPSQPRFVRIGDDADVGVTVTADMNDFDGNVSVKFEIDNPLNNDGTTKLVADALIAENRKFENLTGLSPVEVKFPVRFLGIGAPEFIFTAVTEGGVDAMQTSLDVIQVMDSIQLSTTFSLIATEDGTVWDEDIVLPPVYNDLRFANLSTTQNESDSVLISEASVGHFHDVMVIVSEEFVKTYENLIETYRAEESEETLEGFVSEETFHAIELYDLMGADFWLGVFAATQQKNIYGEAVIEEWFSSEILDMIETAEIDAIQVLTSLTDNTFGLLQKLPDIGWYENRLDRFWDYIDPSLNVLGLYIDKMSGHKIPQNLIDIWMSRVEVFLVDEALNSCGLSSYEWEIYSMLLLSSGIDWTPPDHAFQALGIDEDEHLIEVVRRRLSLETALLELPFMSTSRAVVLLNALFSHDAFDGLEEYLREIVINKVQDIFDDFEYLGRTAFIRGIEHDMMGSAMALSALVKSPPEFSENFALEKFANYISDDQRKRLSSYGGVEFNTFKMIALSEYDLVRTSNVPDLRFSITADESSLLVSNHFTSPLDPQYYREAIPWTQFTDNGEVTESLEFEASGNGEISVSLALDYIPPIYLFPVYRGLFVERFVQRFDPLTKTGTGESLVSIEKGEIVQVTIQITIPSYVTSQVQVVDYVAAGLEPLDPELFSIDDTSDPIYGTYKTFSSDAPSISVDQVIWKSSKYAYLTGTHSVRYHAISVTTGVFVWPQARAFIIDDESVLGLSGGGYFLVTEDPVASNEVESLFGSFGVPYRSVDIEYHSCGDCGNGVCDLASGNCVSYDNFI